MVIDKAITHPQHLPYIRNHEIKYLIHKYNR